MWYPTLPDFLQIHEQVASSKGQNGGVRDRSVLEQAVVAPQRTGGENRTMEAISEKGAAILTTVIRDRPFENTNEQTGYAVLSVFLDRNGASFQASLSEMGELFYQISDGSVGEAKVASWIKSRLSNRFDQRHLERILSALDRLAGVVEELKGIAGFQDQADTLDGIGSVVSLEVVSLFAPTESKKRQIREDYPAIDEHWGEAFGG